MCQAEDSIRKSIFMQSQDCDTLQFIGTFEKDLL